MSETENVVASTEPTEPTEPKATKIRLTEIEQMVCERCAETGQSAEEALAGDRKIFETLVKQAMEGIRPEAINHKLRKNVNWLNARLNRAGK